MVCKKKYHENSNKHLGVYKNHNLSLGGVWGLNRGYIGFGFDFCFTALQHILGHFGRGQLTLPHCSWASLLGSFPVLTAHSFASN